MFVEERFSWIEYQNYITNPTFQPQSYCQQLNYMGNEQVVDSLHGEALDFSLYLKSATQGSIHSPREETLDEHSFHPEKRWRGQLIDSLLTHSQEYQDQDILSGIMEVIREIQESSFIRAISVLNSLTTSSKKVQSKPLLTLQKCLSLFSNESLIERSVSSSFSLDPAELANSKSCLGMDSASTSAASSPSCSPEKKLFKNNLTVKKNLPSMLRKQISQEHHPIQKITESFLFMLKMKYRSKLDCRSPKPSYSMETLTSHIHQDITFYTSFISRGCTVYKSLLLKHAGIRESHYNRYMKSVLIESMFQRQKIASILYPIILEVSGKSVKNLTQRIPDHVSITSFPIKPQLCVEGMFLNSLMMLSDIDRHLHPSTFFDYLEKIKNFICNDVDEYYRSMNKEKALKIDSENMLGIICFLICRMKPKLKEIYASISLFNCLYGQEMSGEFGAGEYMLTTFNAAFEVLSTEFFSN